jgi:hypothetical protein
MISHHYSAVYTMTKKLLPAAVVACPIYHIYLLVESQLVCIGNRVRRMTLSLLEAGAPA